MNEYRVWIDTLSNYYLVTKSNPWHYSRGTDLDRFIDIWKCNFFPPKITLMLGSPNNPHSYFRLVPRCKREGKKYKKFTVYTYQASSTIGKPIDESIVDIKDISSHIERMAKLMVLS